MGPPPPRPCVSCPYRRNVPSGVWDFAEYEKLRAYDGDLSVQAPQLFQCHQADADSIGRRVCAGWVGCHGGRKLLALRLALIQERISGQTFEVAAVYESAAPLFASGTEAADQGQREIDKPRMDAQHAIRKVARIRSDLAALELHSRD
ncbi:DUF6283 family protein [Nocardia salmonicida]|uniref:DUF6283 family protein n=1 Tax=Nocardia salmonicida TaxID=53431 RepID=UPI003671D18A